MFYLWVFLGSEFHIIMNISVHCCWRWDRLRIKERLSVYKETISISRLANTAGKGGEECLAGNPFIRLKDNLPHKLDYIFPVLSVSTCYSLPWSLQQMISH